MNHPDAVIIAKKIVYFRSKRVIRRGGRTDDSFFLSWHNFSYLMLGGIGLQAEHCSADSIKLRWLKLIYLFDNGLRTS